MMKPGFTLIEIIIVVLISSIIAINLYQTFFQVSRTVTQLSNVIEVDIPLIPLHNQLERDITGIFMPQTTVRVLLEEETKKKKAELAKPENQKPKNQEKKPNQQEKQGATPKPEVTKKEEKKIDNIFYVKSQPGGALTLTFISTGGIDTLEFDGKIRPVPYIRRIAYILQPDPTQPGTSRLIYRFETDKLDIQSIEKAGFLPSYDLLAGVKSLTVEFTVFSVPKADQKGEKMPATKQEPVKLKEWNEKEIFTKYRTLIPAYISLKGTYIDRAKQEHNFEFNFKVPAYTYIKEEKSTPQQLFKKLTEFIEEKIPIKPDAKTNAKPNKK